MLCNTMLCETVGFALLVLRRCSKWFCLTAVMLLAALWSPLFCHWYGGSSGWFLHHLFLLTSVVGHNLFGLLKMISPLVSFWWPSMVRYISESVFNQSSRTVWVNLKVDRKILVYTDQGIWRSHYLVVISLRQPPIKPKAIQIYLYKWSPMFSSHFLSPCVILLKTCLPVNLIWETFGKGLSNEWDECFISVYHSLMHLQLEAIQQMLFQNGDFKTRKIVNM